MSIELGEGQLELGRRNVNDYVESCWQRTRLRRGRAAPALNNIAHQSVSSGVKSPLQRAVAARPQSSVVTELVC